MVEGSASRVEAESTDATLTNIAAAAAGQRRAENFPVALRAVPRAPRQHLLRAYTYARFVDDVGDEAPGDRLALLDRIAADVRRLPDRAVLPPVRELAATVRERGLTVDPLLDLIEANRRDQTITRYETFADLLDYCRYSANPVGRMVLTIAGVDGPDERRWSDAICTALQVLEHCQDVAEDARAGRVYLPAAELRAAGVADADLQRAAAGPALRAVVARQVNRAADLIDEGRPLLTRLRGWARLAVTGYAAGGRATVAALRAADHDVLARPVAPSTARTVTAALRLAVTR